MSTTPRRPGPVAYITLCILIAAGFCPLGFRLVTAALGIPIGLSGNLVVVSSLAVFLSAAGGFGCYLIVRYFRTVRAEDRADREAREAELRAEIARQRSEMAELTERVKDVEDKAWWNDPESVLPEDDTVDLSNVRMLPVRKPPEKRSS